MRMGILDRFFEPTPDRFAAKLQKAVKQAGDTRRAVYDKENFQIQFFDEAGKESGHANLSNLFREYCETPRATRNKFMRQIVVTLLRPLTMEIPDEFEDARPDVLPVVRTRTRIDLVQLQSQVAGRDTATFPEQLIGDHYSLSLVYDLPESTVSLSQDNLDTWGISFYEALEVSLENLAAREFAFGQLGDSLYIAATGDTYDASRLMLLEFIRSLEVAGETVAMIPNRNQLLITGSEDETGLQIMAELADKALDEARPMYGLALRLTDDEWVSWMPSEDHPLYEQFRRLEVKSLYGDYADQKELLDALHERNGTDLFVATYSAVEKESGEVVSYAVWGEGIDTLLPKTHKLVLMGEDQQIRTVAGWDRIQEVLGYLFEGTELFPQRYRVMGFPTNEELARLGPGEL